MGAWGIHFDEDDGSLDVIGEVDDDRDWSAVTTRISNYASGDGYEDGAETVGALELVAAALGSPSKRMDADLAEWCLTHAKEAETLRDQANTAIEAILESSELAELWAESDENEDWREQMRKLQRRLQG